MKVPPSSFLTDEQFGKLGDSLRIKNIFARKDSKMYPCIIGSVVITDCVQNHPSIWAEKGVYNWVLANPILFDKPITAKGRLSFWEFENIKSEVDDDGKHICCCNLCIDEKEQVINFGNGLFMCSYCGGKWYR